MDCGRSVTAGDRVRGFRSVLTATVLGTSVLSVLVVAGILSVVSPAVPAQAAARPHIYAGGGVIGFGDAATINAPPASPPASVMVAMAADPASTTATEGYWLASADGGVYAEGSAEYFGSLRSVPLNGPIVGMAGMPDGKGYWLAAMDGGVFAFGDARFHGSMGGVRLNQPIVGMASTADGKGYWLVASDGGIFSFGDATFYGSMGGTPLNQPVTAIAPTADGKGYWLVASDGGIFSFGDAHFYGSTGGLVLNDPVVSMVAEPHDRGYLLVATDGGIFAFGTVGYYGSLGGGYGGDPHDVPPVAGMVLTPDARGYWLLEPDGWSYSFSDPADPSSSRTRAAIVAVADSQVASDPDRGEFCNPYGPCEEWCALFATWVWQRAGVPIPSFPFTGSIYSWAAGGTGVLPPTAVPLPGDAVLYGTGPFSTATSVHVGVVVQVWPDGAVVTVEGDAGPAPTGALAVVINGPYLPSRSAQYNGVPIYAFAQP